MKASLLAISVQMAVYPKPTQQHKFNINIDNLLRSCFLKSIKRMGK